MVVVMDPLGERYALLAEAATALSGELELDAVLDTITRTAAQVTGAAYAALGVIDSDGRSASSSIAGLTSPP
jgi:GAF domain-containing protein